jgi:hypothetical protein
LNVLVFLQLNMRSLCQLEFLSLTFQHSKTHSIGCNSSLLKLSKIFKDSVYTLIGEDLLSQLKPTHTMTHSSDGNSKSLSKKKSSDLERDSLFILLWMDNHVLITIDQKEKELDHRSTLSLK